MTRRDPRCRLRGLRPQQHQSYRAGGTSSVIPGGREYSPTLNSDQTYSTSWIRQDNRFVRIARRWPKTDTEVALYGTDILHGKSSASVNYLRRQVGGHEERSARPRAPSRPAASRGPPHRPGGRTSSDAPLLRPVRLSRYAASARRQIIEPRREREERRDDHQHSR